MAGTITSCKRNFFEKIPFNSSVNQKIIYTFALSKCSSMATMINFTKMHGLGNDYVYVDCTDGRFGGADSRILNDDELLAHISRVWSDRHTGIGGDGIILILPSSVADFKMRIFNADGSEAKMCGNGSRCVGKYVFDHNLTSSTNVTLETLSGVICLRLNPGADGKVETVEVDMGTPELTPERIPVIVADSHSNRNIEVEACGRTVSIDAVSMGNPHGVVFVDSLDVTDVALLGPALENHPIWPDRANIEFVEVLTPQKVKMRVWERGSGETMACGTGACAVAVASILSGRTAAGEITVQLLGGDLKIAYDAASGHVFMTGPATEVFTGTAPLPE